MPRGPTTSISLHSRTDDDDVEICDYTIGWISTSDEEYTAATWVMDEPHQPNTSLRRLNDQRKFHYQLGRMGNHNVAICVPVTEPGFTVAAVVDDMLLTFPSLRFVLLVGTSSGVPPMKGNHEGIDEHAADVRLGDVVIGTRIVVSSSRGAVQTPGTDVEQSSSRTISTGITEFKRRLAGGLNIGQSLSSLLEQRCMANGCFRRPDPQSDCLYQAEYAHIPKGCECLVPSTKQASVTIPRPLRTQDRQFQVHYGAVGSVDQRIVDARMRDELALENNVLCFQTGTTGVTTKIDCLPIRGVCDYGDSHQYCAWSKYAALTAAVCAKEFLGSVTEYMVFEMRIRASVEGLKWVVDGYIEQAQRLSSAKDALERYQAFMDRVQSRVDYLDKIVSGLQNKEMDMLGSAQAQSALDLDVGLRQTLKQMELNIQRQVKESDYVTREEWNTLLRRVDYNTSRLNKLSAYIGGFNEAIDLTGDILEGTGKQIDNKKLTQIANLLKISRNAREKMVDWVPSLHRKDSGSSGDVVQPLQEPGSNEDGVEEIASPEQSKASETWWGNRIRAPFIRKKTTQEKPAGTETIETVNVKPPATPSSPSNPRPSNVLPPAPSNIFKGNAQGAPGTKNDGRKIPPVVPPKPRGPFYTQQFPPPSTGPQA